MSDISTLPTRAELQPKRCPVTVLHLRADHDRNGNPRRCFVVLDHRGRFVETLDEGYEGESRLRKRWPWFDMQAAAPEQLSCTVSLYVTVAEWARFVGRLPNTATVQLRGAADLRERRVAGTTRTV